jgi:hypothetical protein
MKLYIVTTREGQSSPLSMRVIAGKIAAIKAAKKIHAETENTHTTVNEYGTEIEFCDGGLERDPELETTGKTIFRIGQ